MWPVFKEGITGKHSANKPNLSLRHSAHAVVSNLHGIQLSTIEIVQQASTSNGEPQIKAESE